MKRTIITLLVAVVACMSAMASDSDSTTTYKYLAFTLSDGSVVTFTADGLSITYDDEGNATVTSDGTTTVLALSNLTNMYFTNDASGGTTTYQTGDVNGDGEVTIADVNTIIDIILGNEVDDDVLERADVNGDGEVTIADVNAVIDIILASS